MLSPELSHALEAHTVALNDWLYADDAGLDVDPAGYAVSAEALAALYERVLADSDSPLERDFALEAWSEAQLLSVDERLAAARDRHLALPWLQCSAGDLTWRNWMTYESEAATRGALEKAYAQMVAASAALVPLLEERLAQARAHFARAGVTPVDIWARREGLSPAALAALLHEVGTAGREPFQRALDALSGAVFRRAAGPAELHALYLNRMYEPEAGIFGSSDLEIARAIRAFRAMGQDLSRISLDLADRPRKYPGAFCQPVAVPGDVRVSIRAASPHHVVDLLYHELGHAAHFAGIRADLSFIDRYWIQSGTHETFATLFESLLGEPQFLRDTFGFDEPAVARLVRFHAFKVLLNGAWLGAGALAVVEAWEEGLGWADIEARYARHLADFTGIGTSEGAARLDPFVTALSPYRAGYVLASARVGGWLTNLRGRAGEAWWASPEAQAEISAQIALGGAVRFPAEWATAENVLRQAR